MNSLKAGLLCGAAEATEKATDLIDGAAIMMRNAYGVIGDVFFEAGLLSDEALDVRIPEMVSDVAVAAQWWNGSETREGSEQVRFGQYWVFHTTPEMIRRAAHPQIYRLRAKMIMCPADRQSVRGSREVVSLSSAETPVGSTCNLSELRSGNQLVGERERLLSDYKRAAENPSNKMIYEASNSQIHKPEFYKWLGGKLPQDSATTKNFERFLREKKKPIRRAPTS